MEFCHLNAADDTMNDELCSTSVSLMYLTDKLELITKDHAMLLIARAKTLANIGRLTDAISDALKAIEYQPALIEGYLTAGDIYSAQGKQQNAIKVYEDGLRYVVPSGWPILYERREDATRRLNRVIDFVAELPLEVTETIFVQLQDRENNPYIKFTGVSKLWRQILYQCPSLWEAIQVCGDPFNDEYSNIRLLPFIGKYVQHLQLVKILHNDLKTLIKLPQTGNDVARALQFPFIKSHTPHITALLGNLTKLTIMPIRGASKSRQPFVLNSILSVCTKLEYFSIEPQSFIVIHESQDNVVTYVPSQSSLSAEYRLLELSLRIPSHTHDVLVNLVPHCPHLQGLYTSGTPTPDVISRVNQHCPPLRYLGPYHEDFLRQYVSNNRTDSSPGLNVLFEAQGLSHALISILNKSKHTLRYLYLRLGLIHDPGLNVNQLNQTAFNNLTTIVLLVHNECIQTAKSILRQSPKLEEVELETINNEPAALDNFFNCLMAHDHIRQLDLAKFRSQTTAALDQFFARLATRHHTCKLQRLSMMGCHFSMPETVLNSLGDISTLQSIELRDTCADVKEFYLAEFVQKLQTMPYLETLILDMTNAADSMLIDLARIYGLKSLLLAKSRKITSDGVRRLADENACTLKKRIRVLGCRYVDRDAVNYLEERIR